jgi:uncharacterized repeat protein (TIGR01451 family)
MNRLLLLILCLAICFDLCAQSPCTGAGANIIVSGHSTTNDGLYQQCVGDSIQFACESITIADGSAVEHIVWYIDNVPQDTLGLMEPYVASYDNPVLLHISANIHFANNCNHTVQLEESVVFLAYPTAYFDEGTMGCIVDGGMHIDAHGVVTHASPNTSFQMGYLFLEDNAAGVYNQEFHVTGFSQTHFEHCTDLKHVLINMEHAYAGELRIAVTCPNGTTVDLLSFPNTLGITDLGEPVTLDISPVAGVGYDYYWSMAADVPMFWHYPSLPSGTYLPAGDYCDFIGCPMNGTWTISYTDNQFGDNGYVFYSELGFNAGTVTAPSYNYSYSDYTTYEWSSEEFGIMNPTVSHATLIQQDTAEGYVTYTIANPAGCAAVAEKYLELIDAPVTIDIIDDFMFLPNQENYVEVELNLNPAHANSFHYSWTPASGVVNPYALHTQLLPIHEDTWFVFQSDFTGYINCAFSDSVLVMMPDNAIILTVFHDVNWNGIHDEGENTLQMVPVDCGAAGTIYTNMNGNIFTTMTETNYFEITVDTVSWIMTTPSVIHVDSSTWSGYALYYSFGVVPTPNMELDAEVSLTPPAALCNASSHLVATLYNDQLYYPGGKMVVTIDDMFTVWQTDVTPSLVMNNVYTFDVPPLTYQEIYNVRLFLNAPDETFFGQMAQFTVQGYFNAAEAGLIPLQEADTAHVVIQCAYDPNDKITHTGKGPKNYIDPNTTMEYTINFQNIGNAPAKDVVVTDVISQLLQVATLEPIAWSHDFVLQVNGNMATFRFEDIQLLGIEQNEALSMGFVRFKIKQKPDLAPGTRIENRAKIYFDNNAPIITNTVFNTIYEPTPTTFLDEASFAVYPNPVSNIFQWNDPEYRLVRITNAIGMSIPVTTDVHTHQFNLEGLAAGTYILEFINKDGNVLRRQIIKG